MSLSADVAIVPDGGGAILRSLKDVVRDVDVAGVVFLGLKVEVRPICHWMPKIQIHGLVLAEWFYRSMNHTSNVSKLLALPSPCTF